MQPVGEAEHSVVLPNDVPDEKRTPAVWFHRSVTSLPFGELDESERTTMRAHASQPTWVQFLSGPDDTALEAVMMSQDSRVNYYRIRVRHPGPRQPAGRSCGRLDRDPD